MFLTILNSNIQPVLVILSIIIKKNISRERNYTADGCKSYERVINDICVRNFGTE